MATTGGYTAESIQVLAWFEAVRKRPGMYIGSTGSEALHYLLWEVVGNAVDEHLRGRIAKRIAITIDGAQIAIEDDGRGIPPDAIEPVVTGFRWTKPQAPHVQLVPGLVRCGVAVVNALADSFVIETWRDGHAYRQQFARWEPVSPVRHLGPTTRHGTRVTFVPDFTILERGAWNRTTITTRLRELAALNPNARPRWRGDVLLVDTLHVHETHDGIGVEVAIAFGRDRGALHGFVSYCFAREGTHLAGLRAGMRRAFAPRRRWNARSRASCSRSCT